MSSKQALSHAVPILLCVLGGISGVLYMDDRPTIGLLLVACAVTGVAVGAWNLFRAAQSDDASMSAWPFFFLVTAIDGFFVREGFAGQAIGIVALLALAFLAAIRIRRILTRKV
jgi:hypothetical protein